MTIERLLLADETYRVKRLLAYRQLTAAVTEYWQAHNRQSFVWRLIGRIWRW